MAHQTKPLSYISGQDPLDRLVQLCDIIRLLNSTFDLSSLLNQIVASAAQMMEARSGALMLVDNTGRKLRCEVTSGRASSALKGLVIPLDNRTVQGMVAFRGESYIENDSLTSAYHLVRATSTGFMTVHKLVCVPLRVQERVIGVIEVLDKLNGDDFTPNDLRLLEVLADAAAVAVHNVRLHKEERKKTVLLEEAYNELRRTYDATLQALGGLLDTRDAATFGHSTRVVAFTMRLARQMGIQDPEMLEALQQGALLHDVGKIGVADAILRKPGPLDQDEWKEMRQHPELGYRMLKDVKFLEKSLPVVRYHHERWNGSGYPKGLKGEEIPLEARIFAVADAFDAITSRRPYSEARTYRQSVAILRQESGVMFDPKVVEAFLAVAEAEWQAIGDHTR